MLHPATAKSIKQGRPPFTDGLYNYDARLYDPVIGRFISADPMVTNPFDPQSLNRYSYCRNNPIIYIDPSGYTSEDPNPNDCFSCNEPGPECPGGFYEQDIRGPDCYGSPKCIGKDKSDQPASNIGGWGSQGSENNSTGDFNTLREIPGMVTKEASYRIIANELERYGWRKTATAFNVVTFVAGELAFPKELNRCDQQHRMDYKARNRETLNVLNKALQQCLDVHPPGDPKRPDCLKFYDRELDALRIDID